MAFPYKMFIKTNARIEGNIAINVDELFNYIYAQAPIIRMVDDKTESKSDYFLTTLKFEHEGTGVEYPSNNWYEPTDYEDDYYNEDDIQEMIDTFLKEKYPNEEFYTVVRESIDVEYE